MYSNKSSIKEKNVSISVYLPSVFQLVLYVGRYCTVQYH